MDGLALGEHVRMLLIAGLCRREPLQRGAFLHGLNPNGESEVVFGTVLFTNFNGQWTTVRLCPRGGEIEARFSPRDVDADDVKVANQLSIRLNLGVQPKSIE